MKPYGRILRAAHSIPWAIMPERLEAILGFLELKASGGEPDPVILAAIQSNAATAAARADAMQGAPGSVAVLPLFGVISHRAGMMGDISGPRGTSTDRFTTQFRQAVNDPNVKAIVIDVDSPGGTVDGVPELADEIFKARGKKPTTAVSDCLCASAAYWIAAQCSDFVVSPSSLTGSIGVYASHEDDSAALEKIGVKVSLISAGKYKTEGNAFEALGDEARSAMQSMVDDYYGMFTKAVARARNVKQSDVINGFGEGRVVTAQQAVKLGLADRVATLDQVLAKYGVSRGNASAMSAGVPVSAGPAADDMECVCPCDPCEDGDCGNCDHEGCDCSGCSCEPATGARKAKSEALRVSGVHERMREQLKIASL